MAIAINLKGKCGGSSSLPSNSQHVVMITRQLCCQHGLLETDLHAQHNAGSCITAHELDIPEECQSASKTVPVRSVVPFPVLSSPPGHSACCLAEEAGYGAMLGVYRASSSFWNISCYPLELELHCPMMMAHCLACNQVIFNF